MLAGVASEDFLHLAWNARKQPRGAAPSQGFTFCMKIIPWRKPAEVVSGSHVSEVTAPQPHTRHHPTTGVC